MASGEGQVFRIVGYEKYKEQTKSANSCAPQDLNEGKQCVFVQEGQRSVLATPSPTINVLWDEETAAGRLQSVRPDTSIVLRRVSHMAPVQI